MSSANLRITDFNLDSGNVDRANGNWTVNIDDCREIMRYADDETMTFEWVLDSGTEGTWGIKLQQPDADCDESDPERVGDSDETGCDFVTGPNSISSTTIDYALRPSRVFGFSTADGCLTRTSTIENFDLQFIFSNPNNDDTSNAYVWYQSRVTLNTSRPETPEINSATAGSSVIRISFDELDDDAIDYRAYYSTTPIDSAIDPELQPSNVSMTDNWSGSPIEIENSDFAVGETYYVSVVAINTTGNSSELSTPVTATLQATSDFFETYRAQGGVEEGGYCAAAPARSAAGSAMLLMGALAMTRRRARRGER